MANRLKLLLSKILGTSHSTPDHDKGFSSKVDRFGINFYLEQEKFIQLENGEGNQRELVQRVVLGMLEEQGLAERLPNGFHVSSNVVSNLDDDEANILSLPARFPGHFDIDISGHTKKSSFKVQLSVILDNNNIPVSIQGPLLIAGSSLMYRMTGAELAAFKEVEYHNQLPTEQKTEENNLRLIAALQESVHKGMELELKHFETLDVVIPKSVSLTADNLPDGSLELSPCFGDGSTPQQLENRWHQLDTSANSGALRVENRIVLLQEETMQAVKEVLATEEYLKTKSVTLFERLQLS